MTPEGPFGVPVMTSLPFSYSRLSPPQEYRIQERPTYPMLLCGLGLTGVWWECLLDYPFHGGMQFQAESILPP